MNDQLYEGLVILAAQLTKHDLPENKLTLEDGLIFEKLVNMIDGEINFVQSQSPAIDLEQSLPEKDFQFRANKLNNTFKHFENIVNSKYKCSLNFVNTFQIARGAKEETFKYLTEIFKILTKEAQHRETIAHLLQENPEQFQITMINYFTPMLEDQGMISYRKPADFQNKNYLLEKIDSLEDQIDKINQQNEQLIDQVSLLKKQQQHIKQENEKLQKENQLLTQQINKGFSVLYNHQELMDQNDSLKKDLYQTKQQLKDASEKNQRIDELENIKKKLQLENQQLSKQLTKSKQEEQKVQQLKDRILEEQERAREINQNTENILRQVQQQYRTICQQQQETKDLNIKLQIENERFQQEIELVKQQSTLQIHKLESQFLEQTAQLEKMDESSRQSQGTFTMSPKNLHFELTYNEENNRYLLENQIFEYESTIQNLNNEAIVLKEKNKTQDMQIIKLKTDIEVLSSEKKYLDERLKEKEKLLLSGDQLPEGEVLKLIEVHTQERMLLASLVYDLYCQKLDLKESHMESLRSSFNNSKNSILKQKNI